MRINTDKNCNLVIYDDTDYPINGIEYNLSVSLYIVQKNTSLGSEIIYNKIDLHTYNAAPIVIDKTEQGGFYTICHIIIPKKTKDSDPVIPEGDCIYVHSANYITKNQIDQLLELPLDTTTSTYTTTDNNVSQDNLIKTNRYYFDNGKIYFENLLGEIREVSYLELIDVNPNSTNLVINFYNFFSVCSLRKCYIALCLKIFDDRAFDRCFNGKVDSELIYRRDLVWAALNVILYMIDSGQLTEAQRLLERINGCNGLCKGIDTGDRGCGCE